MSRADWIARRAALSDRAFAIADEAMTAQLCCHAMKADEHGVVWALCDEDGAVVATLAEADTPLIDAVTWLLRRGLCELVESSSGASVVLHAALSDKGVV